MSKPPFTQEVEPGDIPRYPQRAESGNAVEVMTSSCRAGSSGAENFTIRHGSKASNFPRSGFRVELLLGLRSTKQGRPRVRQPPAFKFNNDGLDYCRYSIMYGGWS